MPARNQLDHNLHSCSVLLYQKEGLGHETTLFTAISTGNHDWTLNKSNLVNCFYEIVVLQWGIFTTEKNKKYHSKVSPFHRFHL